MHHRLFVANQVVPQSRILLERLSDARNISMPENSEASCEELVLFSVPLGELILQVGDGGLSRGQTHGHKAVSPVNRVIPLTCLLQD